MAIHNKELSLATINNSNKANLGSDYFTTDEVCKYLKISQRTLQRYRDKGRIRYYQVGRIIRYSKKDIQNWIEIYAMELITKGGNNV